MQLRPIARLGLFALLAPILGAQQPESDGAADLLSSGAWSPNFTIAGLTGPDGFAPVVYDFARGRSGQVIAAGRLRWFGERNVDPLVRLDGGEWRSFRDEWPREVPEIGFSAIAISDEGLTALSTNRGPFGAAPVGIWLDDGDEVRTIGRLQGAVRSLVWFRGALWAADSFRWTKAGSNTWPCGREANGPRRREDRPTKSSFG